MLKRNSHKFILQRLVICFSLLTNWNKQAITIQVVIIDK